MTWRRLWLLRKKHLIIIHCNILALFCPVNIFSRTPNEILSKTKF
uniref:Uncharacterized protein n=1 Tax=Anguilla anguilla TaxID=7936 RepID=A0A0E9TPY3_ANGAN